MKKKNDSVRTGTAAMELGVTQATIISYLQKGYIKGFRLPSKKWLIEKSEIERLKKTGVQNIPEANESKKLKGVH